MIRRILILPVLLTLGACGLFGGDKDGGTPVVGNRVAVLPGETGIEADAELASVAVSFPAMARNVDWGQPGGSPAKAAGHLQLAASPQRAWTASIGAGSDGAAYLTSTPVIEAGRIYTMDILSTIRAFDAATGAPVWTAELTKVGEKDRSAFGGGVSAFGGRIYAASGYGIAAAYDANTGTEIWRQDVGTPLRGSPTIADGRMLVMTQDNQLVALDTTDGEREWDVIGTIEPAGLLGAAAPAVAQGTAIVGFSSGELTAVRMENGRTVWQDALARTGRSTALAALGDIDAPPVIDNGQVFAIGHGGRMVALELATGQRIWEQSLAGVTSPVVAGDWVFAVTIKGQVVAVQRADGRIRWVSQLPAWRNVEKKKGPIYYRGPVLAGDRLWLTSSEGGLIAVSPYDGSVQSTQEIAETLYLPPVVANGVLYTLSEDGRLSAFR
ncbi:PQQ-binding-like beta-propeller repeat protein [Pacificimonas sp. WHA3]|uniref:PQQ-binding-like beta-propeller repeat protein n=1 Tax=Pacificimonas pallii TaxID=2827236 RepID=A0ABS6SAS1_9SPHN|nr:PQQ-like beta-propeller repeat protein [Pacificimonas pallii]MBV7255430.1 PQQ-binding-like beta-propeller repeat protein [Pacificimonas pallii]